MKTKIIIAAGTVFFAAVVLATLYGHKNRSMDDALFRANVEALVAGEEEDHDLTWAGCSTSYTGVYCSTIEIGGIEFHLKYYKVGDILDI